ncbi:hypothetical protein [Streptomyces niveus]|uniref:hypothetical protein n=1 Tax=Streptomyces niveus TaxID=193462 RepID=UPI00343736AA
MAAASRSVSLAVGFVHRVTCRAQPNSVAHKASTAAARARRAVDHLFLLCLIGANRQLPI